MNYVINLCYKNVYGKLVIDILETTKSCIIDKRILKMLNMLNINSTAVFNIYLNIDKKGTVDISNMFARFYISNIDLISAKFMSNNNVNLLCNGTFRESKLWSHYITSSITILEAEDMYKDCSYFDTLHVKGNFRLRKARGMFSGCKLMSVPIEKMNLSFENLEDVSYMFYDIKEVDMTELFKIDMSNVKKFDNFIKPTERFLISKDIFKNVRYPEKFLEGVQTSLGVTVKGLREMFPNLNEDELVQILMKYSDNPLYLFNESGVFMDIEHMNIISLYALFADMF